MVSTSHDPKCCSTIYITYKNKIVEYTVFGYKKGRKIQTNIILNICIHIICLFWRFVSLPSKDSASKVDYYAFSVKISKKLKIQFLATKSGEILNLTILFYKRSMKNVFYTIWQSFCENIFSWSEVMVLTDFSAHLTWHA